MLLRHLMLQWFRQTARDRAANNSQPSPHDGEDHDTPVDIAIVFPSQLEAGGTVDQLKDANAIRSDTLTEHLGIWSGTPVVVAETGTGWETTAQAVENLISLRHPKWLIVAGFACSLKENLRPGHILLPDRLLAGGLPPIPVGLVANREQIQQTPNLHTGALITTEQTIRDPADRDALAEETGAVAYDLESYAAAEACQRHTTRMLAAYVVTEGVDTKLPVDVEQLLNQSSLAAKLGAAAGALWNRPSVAKSLWQLHEQTVQSSDRLARFLSGIVAQLASAPR